MTTSEPTIIVNGTQLTIAQTMTLRVALSAYVWEMGQPNALGDDETGQAIAAGYRARGHEVLKIMLDKPEQTAELDDIET